MDIEKLLGQINDFVWGPPTLILLFGTHLWLTWRTRFIQRYIGQAIRISFSRNTEGEGDVSQFGALVTALAATIGAGNLVGVATAVAAGGPGAVMWIWLTGVFGIATKYAESLLAVKYRIRTADGSMAGGAMYVIERGLGQKWLAIAFAAFTAVAAFGIGNMVQANSITNQIHEAAGISPWITGGVLTVLTALTILGGIGSIARVCEALVPFMAIFNIVGSIVLLVMNFEKIPESLRLIVVGAFTPQAAVGGFLGAGVKEAMRYGIARGLFSNEAGLGSGAIVAAAAQTKNAVRQALVSASGVFWDTVVMCALTGLVIVNSGKWTEGLKGAALTHAAFEEVPYVGATVLTVGMLTFVFATILGWSYYGEKAAEYLGGRRAILPYRVLWVIAVMVGSVATVPSVWAFADIANALMAIPNLIALLLLQKVIVSETDKYLWSGNIDAPEKDG